MSGFPTAVSARRCLDGDLSGAVESLGWVAARAGLVGAGLYLAGEREHLLRKSLAGSLAVQAFVFGWSALERRGIATLPSADAAMRGEPGPLVATYLFRSAMVAAGLYAAGERQHLVRNALAGTAAIEAAVLLWAARERDRTKTAVARTSTPALSSASREVPARQRVIDAELVR